MTNSESLVAADTSTFHCSSLHPVYGGVIIDANMLGAVADLNECADDEKPLSSSSTSVSYPPCQSTHF